MFHITNSISLHSKSLRALKQQFSKMAYSGNIKVPESSSSTPTTKAKAGHHRAQQIDQQSALQMSQKENNNIIPFTLTFHPHNHAVKSIILKNFKLLQNADPDTGKISGIFTQPQLISFKRDKNIGNFLVSSAFKTSEQTGTFKCARAQCKTCPFIYNVEKLSEPKRSIKIRDHFTCTSANVFYCITCTLCKK